LFVANMLPVHSYIDTEHDQSDWKWYWFSDYWLNGSILKKASFLV
jgi:hypothetical protein